MIKIPLYRPWLGGREKEYVMDCIDTTWISSKGKYIGLFESAFADYVGSPHAASVCNGTVALHLALLALGIGEGDEVIVPTFTYVASVNAITYTGAKPVFCDSLLDTWQMDPADVERKITNRTRAIMAVHLYGHPCDMERISKLAQKNNLYIIEDCAEALGSRYKGQHVGTFGDVASFSFFGNKTITTGEGGIVLTSDASIDQRVRKLKGQGLSDAREYWHDVVGYNYRMTNICAAIGLAQVERVNDILERKLWIASLYADKLKTLPVTFHQPVGDVVHSYWICSILTKGVDIRDATRKALANAGVETRPLFPPIHLMPIYQGKTGDFPIAEDISSCGFNLPSYPELTESDIDYIVEVIKAVI